MTAAHPGPLTLVPAAVDERTLRVELSGDLDFVTADGLLDGVTRLLRERPGLTDLRLDCGGLAGCDSAGLAVLLTLRRRAALVRVRLHLDARPAALDRLLDVTGTLEHLTGAPPEAADADPARNGRP